MTQPKDDNNRIKIIRGCSMVLPALILCAFILAFMVRPLIQLKDTNSVWLLYLFASPILTIVIYILAALIIALFAVALITSVFAILGLSSYTKEQRQSYLFAVAATIIEFGVLVFGLQYIL